MKYKLIRNATAKLFYGNAVFLLDPSFTKKGKGVSYAGKETSPLVDMPCMMWEAESRTDAVVLSHIHSDHFDAAAADALDKDHPVLVQPGDEGNELLKEFIDVRPGTSGIFNEVAYERVPARHGTSPAVLEDMGPGTGVVFMAAGEDTLYWAGDTVWFEGVEATIRTFAPKVIVVHAGSAMWSGEPITMNEEDVVKVCKAAPEAKVIAIHMECCDHCIVTRKSLREAADAAGISREQLLIPADGEEIVILQEAAF
ncbi:MAG: MBL fold metallo-hydrolase [Clostridia bacterium]|nr:MBL fold metallo-hydrolase [Clostridia bacterium]